MTHARNYRQFGTEHELLLFASVDMWSQLLNISQADDHFDMCSLWLWLSTLDSWLSPLSYHKIQSQLIKSRALQDLVCVLSGLPHQKWALKPWGLRASHPRSNRNSACQHQTAAIKFGWFVVVYRQPSASEACQAWLIVSLKPSNWWRPFWVMSWFIQEPWKLFRQLTPRHSEPMHVTTSLHSYYFTMFQETCIAHCIV